MSYVAEQAHVSLSGDVIGDYVVEDRRPDGRLVLAPNTKSADAVLARHGAKPMSAHEFERDFGDLPTDGEG